MIDDGTFYMKKRICIISHLWKKCHGINPWHFCAKIPLENTKIAGTRRKAIFLLPN